MPQGDNELTRALNRRRQEVDRLGSQFTKSPEQATADVTWEEQHESQFTPRSRHQRTADDILGGQDPSRVAPDDSEGRVPSKEHVASSGDAAGGAPLQDGANMVSSRLMRSGFAVGAAERAAGRSLSPGGGSSASSSKTASTVVASSVPQPTVMADATVGMSAKPARVPALALGTSPLLAWGDAPTARMSSSGPATNETLWHNVVQGNVAALESLVAQGALASGRLMDHNGHSILWNAVAFQQPQAALFLLRQFPPNDTSMTGVDLTEVHARRGDSLLHLCLYLSDFSAAAAEVFRSLFRAGEHLQAPRELANQHGQTFVHIAAARLNFWVLRFILSNAPETAVLFQRRDSTGHTPLDILLRRFCELGGGAMPARPTPVPPPADARLPEWTALPRYMPRGSGGATPPPFADLVLEVEDRSSPERVVRMHAHRAVLAGSSGVFHEQLRKHPPGKPLRVDPLCCRSAEVLAVVLSFLYTGELMGTFDEDGFLLWQLLCVCTQYGLPQPLTTYARTALVYSLGLARHAPIVPVLLQAVDKVGLTSEEGLFTACVFLNNPEAAPIPGGLEGKAQALLSALAEVEVSVLRAQSAARAPGAEQDAEQAAAGTGCLLQRQSSQLLVPVGSAGPVQLPCAGVGQETVPSEAGLVPRREAIFV